jgi:uncharacterized protein YndB with AHSA1/START domain
MEHKMRLQKSVEIAAVPEKVWPFLVKPAEIMRWFTLLRKFEFIGSRQSGPGTSFYYEEKSGPQIMKLSYVVTEWAEPKRLVFVLTSGPLKKDDQVWNLEAIPVGTKFTIVEDFEISGGIAGRMLNSFLARAIGRRIEKIQLNLKRLVEAQVV